MQVSLSANHQASTRFSCFFEFARCFLWRFRGTDSYFAIYMSFVGCICLLQNCPHRCGDNHGVVVRKRSLGVASFIWHLQCLSWKYELLCESLTSTLFWMHDWNQLLNIARNKTKAIWMCGGFSLFPFACMTCKKKMFGPSHIWMRLSIAVFVWSNRSSSAQTCMFSYIYIFFSRKYRQIAGDVFSIFLNGEKKISNSLPHPPIEWFGFQQWSHRARRWHVLSKKKGDMQHKDGS